MVLAQRPKGEEGQWHVEQCWLILIWGGWWKQQHPRNIPLSYNWPDEIENRSWPAFAQQHQSPCARRHQHVVEPSNWSAVVSRAPLPSITPCQIEGYFKFILIFYHKLNIRPYHAFSHHPYPKQIQYNPPIFATTITKIIHKLNVFLTWSCESTNKQANTRTYATDETN